MGRLLNKTFFRFVFGFVSIIVLSLAIVIATNYYDAKLSESEAVTASPDVFPREL